MRSRRLRFTSAVVAVAALLGASQAAAQTTSPACSAGTTVQTTAGAVCGVVARGVTNYLGIPYAAAPEGRLRWAAPQPRAPWSGTFAATAPGNPCPQTGIAGAVDEDCLNLNVKVPLGAAGALPVMVEIHGGGFLSGVTEDTTNLAAAGGVITVEVNYRLGILGFLAHPGLGPHAGNYGIQDQQAALRWVRQNIGRFGGDPGNVTLFGSSAGGASVCANTVSPGAAGPFQKGDSQSGVYNSLLGANTSWQPGDCKAALPSEQEAQQAGERFAGALGCAGDATGAAECLRGLSVQALLAQAGNGLAPDRGTIAPIVDGRTLPLAPAEAFARGRVNDVTLMFGVERDETQLASASTPADYDRLVRQQYGPFARTVMALYPLERFPDSSPFIAYRTIVADSNAVCPAQRIERELSGRLRVFAYEDDNPDPPQRSGQPPTQPIGAYHIGVNRFLLLPELTSFNANQQVYSDQVTAEWTGFARTGNPTVTGTPWWPPFTRRDPVTMSLAPSGDSELTREIPRQHNCGFWDAVARRAVR